MNRREALLTLNLSQDSSQEQIKTEYRKMALELHPDKNKKKEFNRACRLIGLFNETSEERVNFKKGNNISDKLKKDDGGW